MSRQLDQTITPLFPALSGFNLHFGPPESLSDHYQCFVGFGGQPLLVTKVVDVTQPTWQLIQPPGVCKVVVVGQQASKHGIGIVWTVVQLGAGGQVAELNVVPQKAITLMLDTLKR
jgi:hypothetical protein